MSQQYVYSIANDFPNHSINPDQLTLEIQNSSIATALDHIDTSGDTVVIWFVDVLSGGDQTTLTSVVNAHQGTPSVASISDVTTTYYLDTSSNPVASSGSLLTLPKDTTEVATTVAVAAGPGTTTLIAKYSTPPGDLNQAIWNADTWDFNIWASCDTPSSATIVIHVYRKDSVTGAQNQIFSCSTSALQTVNTLMGVTVREPSFLGNSDDLLIITLVARNYGSSPINVTVTTGGTTHNSNIVVPLNGDQQLPTGLTFFFPSSGHALTQTAGSSPTPTATGQTWSTSNLPPISWNQGLWSFTFNVSGVVSGGGNFNILVRALDASNTATPLFSVSSYATVSAAGTVTINTYQPNFPNLGATGVNLRFVVNSSGNEIDFIAGDNTSFVKTPLSLISLSSTQGAQGWQGNVGAQGNQGWQGSIGAQGNQGWQGNQGNVGVQGNQGWQGNQGNQGRQGWQGNQGNQGWQGTQGLANGLTNIESDETQNIFFSRLPYGTTIACVSGTAYFVYLGRTVQAITPKFVEFYVTGAGAGTQTAEVGFFSTPAAPNKAAQTVSKLVSTGTVNSLTATGVCRNTSAFATSIPAGTHVWAGIRTAMATTQPTIAGLVNDYAQGHVLSTAGSGALTGTGTWTGALITTAAPGTAQCPELRGSMI